MDTTLTIERVTHALDKRFSDLIDLSDLRSDASPEERRGGGTVAVACGAGDRGA